MTPFAKDLAERVASTFVQAFVGAITVTELTDRDMWLSAAVAGVAAAASLVKGLLARNTGLPDSASLSRDI